jgi:hypothetical protein
MYKRILPIFRWLSVFITLILLAAFQILFFTPDETDTRFAWKIAPHMTAYLVGAGYLGGAYFFARIVYSARRLWWHEVKFGVAGVTAFCVTMAGITLAHWDQFHYDRFAGQLWVALYFSLPILLPLLMIVHAAQRPEKIERAEPVVPDWMRRLYFVIGLALFLAGGALFMFPDQLGPLWPWPLTPITAQAVGGWLILPGVVGILLPLDPRWSAWKITLTAQTISIGFIFIGIALSWQEFSQAFATALFAGGLGAILLLAALITWRVRRLGA